MGMNFYLRLNTCEKCARYDELHIGKSSMGGQFSFRAYDYEGAEPRIRSVKDWLTLTQEGRIFDENGKEYSQRDFWSLVNSKKSELGNFAAAHRPSEWHYLDEDGFSMTNREFS